MSKEMVLFDHRQFPQEEGITAVIDETNNVRVKVGTPKNFNYLAEVAVDPVTDEITGIVNPITGISTGKLATLAQNASNNVIGVQGIVGTTWALKPLASEYIGTAFITDIGVENGIAVGSYWTSNGTEWKPLNGCVVLEASGVAKAAHTGTLALTNLHTYNAVAGLCGLNGTYRVKAKWTVTNNANLKTMGFYLNSTIFAGIGTTSTLGVGCLVEVQNRNSASSQLGSNGTFVESSGTGAFTTLSVNTALAHTINIAMTLSNIADSATLESYRIELVN